MARLHEHAEVTLIDALDPPGLTKLRDALPGAHGLLGASLRLDAALLDWHRNWRRWPACPSASTTTTSST